MTSQVFTLEEQRRKLLREFALSVIREVGLRCHGFPPRTPEEQIMKNSGVVWPNELDAVKALDRP